MPPEPHRGRTLAACIVASALVFLDGSVVNVALPAIRDDLGGGLAAQQWVVEGFLLALAAFLLLGGSLGDLLGHRRILRIGTLAFGVTSLLCALAPTVELLVAARIVQGLAGAILVPVSLALITDTFAEDERGAAIGTWTAWTSVAMIAGPFVGGLLVDQLDWRLIFGINVPLVAVTMWLARSIAADAERPKARVDVTGAVLVSLGLAGVIFALVEQPAHGWGAGRVALPGAGGLALLAAFLGWEARTAAPMLPLGLFRERNFSVINATTLFLYAPLGASSFLLSVFLQQVAGYEATTAGLALLPTTLVVIALARRFGGLADRIGAHRFVAAGSFIVAIAFALLMRVDERGDYFSQVFPAMLVLGLGLSLAVAPLTAKVLSSAPPERAGTASGINNAASRVAGLLAIAALGGLAATTFADRIDTLRAESPAAAQAEIAASRERPFQVFSDAPTAAERQAVEAAQTSASVRAFHVTMGVGAALALLGSLIAAVGLTDRRHPAHAALAPTGGDGAAA
ncbi:MAG: MFS transporter [Solirubrobacteraceae bacterium]|nr:MFS transporter [Solirubrobacteraceae bacterium]